MIEVLFLFSLYGLGVIFGLLFRQLPVIFSAVSGFLWGALIWVVGGVLMLMLRVPYTPISMTVLLILLVVGFAFLHIRNRSWQLSGRELIQLLLTAVVFLGVLILFSAFNFSAASPDSSYYIATGRKIAYEGLGLYVLRDLSLRGIFLSQLQSTSVLLGVDYLVAAQPAFAITFALVHVYLSQRVLSTLISKKHLAVLLSVLTSLGLFSTYFMVFQFFYIHNNLISSVYLFVALSSFWLASVEKEETWMLIGVFGLLGFSLARNEGVVFALLYLLLVISSGQISRQIKMRTIMPYLITMIIWYGYLLGGVATATRILSLERTVVIICALIALGALVMVSENEWIKGVLFPQLPKIILGFLLIVLLFMVLRKPEHMKISAGAIISNIFVSGGWGLTWLMFSFIFVLSLAGPRVPFEELFFYGIPLFFLMLLALSYFRVPYRSIWVDSANRMSTHILPIVILYALMKVAQGVTGNLTFVRADKDN